VLLPVGIGIEVSRFEPSREFGRGQEAHPRDRDAVE
jgi:hypothetical protein